MHKADHYDGWVARERGEKTPNKIFVQFAFCLEHWHCYWICKQQQIIWDSWVLLLGILIKYLKGGAKEHLLILTNNFVGSDAGGLKSHSLRNTGLGMKKINVLHNNSSHVEVNHQQINIIATESDVTERFVQWNLLYWKPHWKWCRVCSDPRSSWTHYIVGCFRQESTFWKFETLSDPGSASGQGTWAVVQSTILQMSLRYYSCKYNEIEEIVFFFRTLLWLKELTLLTAWGWMVEAGEIPIVNAWVTSLLPFQKRRVWITEGNWFYWVGDESWQS